MAIVNQEEGGKTPDQSVIPYFCFSEVLTNSASKIRPTSGFSLKRKGITIPRYLMLFWWRAGNSTVVAALDSHSFTRYCVCGLARLSPAVDRTAKPIDHRGPLVIVNGCKGVFVVSLGDGGWREVV
jgi:hypothetical protein